MIAFRPALLILACLAAQGLCAAEDFATLIKKDAHLKSLPVMIVSYKDREEDRMRGLEVGADYYLTKSDFHDEQLVRAVVDLVGEAGR